MMLRCTKIGRLLDGILNDLIKILPRALEGCLCYSKLGFNCRIPRNVFACDSVYSFLPRSMQWWSEVAGYSRVVTRYMGSGITASGSGSWTRDPGSQVMGFGSANFFLSWRGSRIDRFLDTLFFMRNKNIPFCKEKGLFSGLLTIDFYVSVTQSAV